MWSPYGQRGLDESYGRLDIDHITPREAYAVLKGSSHEDQNAVIQIVVSYGYNWNGKLEDAAEAGIGIAEVTDILAVSHDAQQTYAASERDAWLHPKRGGLVATIGKAASQLCRDGLITTSQLDYIRQSLEQPDGTPTIQVTPMTYLERDRQSLAYDYSEADFRMAGFVDYRLGIQYLPVRLGHTILPDDVLGCVHEAVHANMQAMEIQDIARADGWRFPFPSVHGVRIVEPSADIPNGEMGFGSAENMESNEAWTEFMGRAIMAVEPSLGKSPVYPDTDLYTRWAGVIGSLYKNYLKVYRALTHAVFTDALPQNPLAKREAIDDMHSYADKVFGISDALPKLFRASGGTITNIFPDTRSTT